MHAYATYDWPIAILCDLTGRADVRQQGQCDCLLSQNFMEQHASWWDVLQRCRVSEEQRNGPMTSLNALL